MNDPTPQVTPRLHGTARHLPRCQGAWRRGWRSWAARLSARVSSWRSSWRSAWLSCWPVNPAASPVWVGVSLQADPWHVVLVEPLESQEPGPSGGAAVCTADAALGVQQRSWQPTPRPDVRAAKDLTAVGPWTDAQQLAWRSALEGLRTLLPLEGCHLVLSWPDEALWSTTLTLTGPVLSSEMTSVLEQEIAAVLPVDAARTAWDVRGPGFPIRRWSWAGGVQGVWSRCRARPRDHTSRVWEGDVTVQVWAMPVALASQLEQLGRALGFASLVIEPCSVSLARATSDLRFEPPVAQRSVVMEADPPAITVALGAACRRDGDGPDLLRRLHSVWRVVGRRRTREWRAWLLGMGLALGLGHAMGGWQVDRWIREREVWDQWLRHWHARHEATTRHRAAVQHAHAQAQLQSQRHTHNLHFVQVLKGWAATLPEGVRWQQISLRPQQIELQGQARDVERLSRWLDRWPEALPGGGRQQLQWQPGVAGNGAMTTGAPWGVSVQVSWEPAAGERP